MNIRLINLSSRLPVDETLENEFKWMIDIAYRNALKNSSPRGCIDIFFVDEYDQDLNDPLRKPGGDEPDGSRLNPKIDHDWLGVYFGFHPKYNRSIIKVCPERVMACALSFTGGVKLPLIRRYPVLLVAVVIHELAHLLMDDDRDPAMTVYPWKWLIDCRLEEDPTFPYTGGRQHSYHSRAISGSQVAIRHFIEESLAEAFIFKQRVTGVELDYLRAFTAASPPGYSSGLYWSGSHAEVKKSASSWARFKTRYLHHPRWDFVFAAGNTPLDTLIATLKGGGSVAVFDFERKFIDYLAKEVSKWQVAYQSDKSTWGDRLYGPFGVYSHLVNSEHLRASVRLKFLKEWATSGSLEAIDKLHETRAKNAESRGNFTKALEYLEARLLHLPLMGHNDYWHKRKLDEINAAISTIQSRNMP